MNVVWGGSTLSRRVFVDQVVFINYKQLSVAPFSCTIRYNLRC